MCFHRLGEIRDRSDANQRHRASGLTLVVAAIILWNTLYLGQAVDALRAEGEMISDQLLAHWSPLGWEHVNLTGDDLTGDDLTGDDVWPAADASLSNARRPLRRPDSLLMAA